MLVPILYQQTAKQHHSVINSYPFIAKLREERRRGGSPKGKDGNFAVKEFLGSEHISRQASMTLSWWEVSSVRYVIKPRYMSGMRRVNVFFIKFIKMLKLPIQSHHAPSLNFPLSSVSFSAFPSQSQLSPPSLSIPFPVSVFPSQVSDLGTTPPSLSNTIQITIQYNTENFYSAGILGVAKFKGASSQNPSNRKLKSRGKSYSSSRDREINWLRRIR